MSGDKNLRSTGHYVNYLTVTTGAHGVQNRELTAGDAFPYDVSDLTLDVVEDGESKLYVERAPFA